ncbi:peptidoglycan editing factor PgeF [Chenggangzhangella methanolivorans]|uniref:Purine nucleoside phosphorylase n=1 Tax=Chenggangzhangella methanolivorans TaxID=1437009 RepID=A0A9E6RHW9_9HYPH|nr:peptidoglycan editing factor PgeF [Chenggangzhangella methanolivorans]QZO01327.1 peptidoglycan editing factor PgeF [Chenggangzhangella methanolivorans]
MDAATSSTVTVPTVTSPALSALPGISHAFFTRLGGVSTGIYAGLNGGLGSNDDPEAVRENRARMTATLGVAPGRLAVPWQVHSAEAVVTDGPWAREKSPHVDGVATVTPGLAVAVTIADCCPILFADPKARVVAAAHSGWKGAIGGVLEATLLRMEELGANRADVVAALGPCIRQKSYEVGPEFAGRFTAEDAANARFFEPSARPGHAMFELGGYVVERLRNAGVGHVDDLGIDTYSDEERFFSFRRTTHRGEPDYGRMIAAIALV